MLHLLTSAYGTPSRRTRSQNAATHLASSVALHMRDSPNAIYGFSITDGATSSSLPDHARSLDWGGPFRDLALDQFLQVSRRAPFGRDNIVAGVLQPLLHGGHVHRGDGGVVEFLHDRRWRALGQEEAEPGRSVEIGQPLLMCGGERRQA